MSGPWTEGGPGVGGVARDGQAGPPQQTAAVDGDPRRSKHWRVVRIYTAYVVALTVFGVGSCADAVITGEWDWRLANWVAVAVICAWAARNSARYWAKAQVHADRMSGYAERMGGYAVESAQQAERAARAAAQIAAARAARPPDEPHV